MFSIDSITKNLLLGGALWLLLSLRLTALDPADGNIPTPAEGVLTKNGYASRTDGNVFTYNIPITDYPSTITIDLRGGDGGFAQSGPSTNRDKRASKGGGGIEGTATFNIHPRNAGALRPGGQIRLIPGNKGFDRQSGNLARAASGGGGASGVLYHGPLETDDWRPLIIAGGGGGAYASTVTGKVASNRNGGAGQSSESGQRGMGNGSQGGSDGSGGSAGTHGNNSYGLGGGGGGWLTGGANGGEKGYPLGGAGGVLSVNTEKGAHGGFGCGGGGDGGKVTFAGGYAMSGGGGGGYSGGGGGANDYGGGGGGSFVATGQTLNGILLPVAQTNASRWTPRGAGLKQHGYVSIQTFGTGTGSVQPKILGDLSIEVDFHATNSYVDTGITAEDFLGNALQLTEISNNVNLAISGDYEVKYKATDQYGQEVTATRSVTVKAGSYRPTFTLPAAINVTQAGQQSPQVVTNFNANWLGDGDSNESLVRYEIRGNSNPSLLADDPIIANNGKLTLTPTGTTAGITTLTIVAIDNGPDPTVRESVEKTIDLRINMAPSAGQFLVGANPDVFSASINFSEDSSSLIVGTVKSVDPDNPDDVFYQLGGSDNGKFTLGLTDGVLKFNAQPNYETPNDIGGNRTYDLQIITNDPSSDATIGNRIVSNVTVHLTDANEPPSLPSLTNNSIPENTQEVGILNSTDPDLSNNTVNFSIVEHPSSDWQHFQITNVNNQAQLEFINAPNFESPTDIGGFNDYSVIVRATSNGQSEQQNFTIYVTNAEELLSTPTLTNDTLSENTKAVGTFESVDPDDTEVTFALSQDHGPDWQLFDLDPSSGALTFKVAPDYEALTNEGGDAFFDITVIASSGEDAVSQSFTIEVEDVDEAPTTPVFADGSDSNIVENQTVVGTVVSSDPDNDTVSYAISDEFGLDSNKFTIDSNGLLSMKAAPDYENPGYGGEVPAYEVCVVANANGKSTLGFFEIVVTNLGEIPTVPALTSNSVEENTTAVGKVTSTADGIPVVYEVSITEGADWQFFQINGDTGDLSFINPPNFEERLDSGADNNYEVVVIAHSAEGSTKNTFNIQVTDTNDPVARLELDSLTIDEGIGGVGFLTAVDEDGTDILFAVSESSGADSGKFYVSNAQNRGLLLFKVEPNYEQPHDANGDNVYEVTIIATSGGDSISRTFNITVLDKPDSTRPPTLDNDTIIENTKIIGNVSALDEDSELRYSIIVDENDDLLDGALFEIHPVSGVLSFKTAPDYENPLGKNADNTYQVHVKATPLDNIGGNDATFTIHVTNSTSYSLAEFRAEYNLAADGSDDWKDRSGNGIPNIAYLKLGLGDPSNPSPVPATETKPGLPSVHKTEHPKIVAYTYSLHRAAFMIATPQVSTNLIDWSDPLSGTPTLVPLGIYPFEYIHPENTSEDQNYRRYTIYYLIEEDEVEFGTQPAYPNILFRMKLEVEDD